MQLLASAWFEVSEAIIKKRFRKVGILKKLAEEAINYQDDPFKDLAAEELEETINEFRVRFPNEVWEELNAVVLFDIDAELSTNGDKPSDAENFAEERGEAIQEEEDDIDVVYDERSAPPSAFEIEKPLRFFNSLHFFCDKGEDLREVILKVNISSQRAIAKRKKQKTIKDYFNVWFFQIMYLCITHYA